MIADLLPGALAGLAGGLVFAVTMWEVDRLPVFAEIVGASSETAGLILVIVVAVVIGSGFGVLVRQQRPGAGETLLWGLIYGAFWWYLGRLTLLPLAQGKGLTWDVAAAQNAVPELLGLVLYGATLGLSLVGLQWRRHFQTESLRVTRGCLFRGVVAGLISAYLLGTMANAQDQLPVFTGMAAVDSGFGVWWVLLLIGILAGVGYAFLFPRANDGTGVGLIRGTVYGFVWWVAGALTLIPIISGSGMTWSVAEIQSVFPTLPGYLLFGGAIALLYQFLGGLVRLLFSEFVPGGTDEGIGAQGLRVVGRSMLAALVGGLLFSLLMWQIGFLPRVAELVGSSSAVGGFFIHMAIAGLVGLSYGLLFRRQSYDVGSALGWGVSYGIFWSILGPMTLMPMLLGGSPLWTAEAAASVFPNLVGHIGYGAGLGITFFILETRYNPWWIPSSRVRAERQLRYREQVVTSGPAVWTLLILLGLTMPVLLGKGSGLAPIY